MLLGRLVLQLIILILIVRMSTDAKRLTSRQKKKRRKTTQQRRYQYVPQPQNPEEKDPLFPFSPACPEIDWPSNSDTANKKNRVSVWGLFTALIVASTVVGNLVHNSNSNNNNNNNNNNVDNQNNYNQNGNMAENQNQNQNMIIMGRSASGITGWPQTLICGAVRDSLNYTGIEQVLRRFLALTAASILEDHLAKREKRRGLLLIELTIQDGKC